jgi:hypothetical protein
MRLLCVKASGKDGRNPRSLIEINSLASTTGYGRPDILEVRFDEQNTDDEYA